MTVQGATGDAVEFPDYRLMTRPFLRHGHMASEQSNIKRLPFAGTAWLFRLGCKEPINGTHVMARRLGKGVIFHLHFISASEINSAVGIGRTIHLDVEFEIFKCLGCDQIGSGRMVDQASVTSPPNYRNVWNRRTLQPEKFTPLNKICGSSHFTTSGGGKTGARLAVQVHGAPSGPDAVPMMTVPVIFPRKTRSVLLPLLAFGRNKLNAFTMDLQLLAMDGRCPQRPTKSPCNMSPDRSDLQPGGHFDIFGILNGEIHTGRQRCHSCGSIQWLCLKRMTCPTQSQLGIKGCAHSQPIATMDLSYLAGRINPAINVLIVVQSLKDGRDSSQEEVGSYHGTVYRPAGMKSF